MDNGRYGSRRQTQYRSVLPVVVVVCDDAKTAVAYFTEMQREFKGKVTLKIVPAPCSGATADDVVKAAISEWQGWAEGHSGGSPEAHDQVWALLDLEVEPRLRKRATAAQLKAGTKGVRVALSDPCFEVWTLAHLTDTGAAFADCKAVVAAIKTEWKKKFGTDFGNKKSQADYSKLMPLRQDAIRNCQKRDPQRDRSWTEVHLLVKSIVDI